MLQIERFASSNTQSLYINYYYWLLLFSLGTIFEDNREEWLSGIAMGTLHHTERRLPAENQLNQSVS